MKQEAQAAADSGAPRQISFVTMPLPGSARTGASAAHRKFLTGGLVTERGVHAASGRAPGRDSGWRCRSR